MRSVHCTLCHRDERVENGLARNGRGKIIRDREWNGKDKDVSAMMAEIPLKLARPFAEACMDALREAAMAPAPSEEPPVGWLA